MTNDYQVRATSLIEEAHKQGILPPLILLSTLTTEHPTLAEWTKILNLRHLVRCFEHTFLLPKNKETSFFRDDRRDDFNPPSEPLYLQLWSENFHIASYRVFIMAAVLSRSYQEPFFSLEKPDDFLEQLARDFEEGDWPDRLTAEEVEHLCEFPVYDLEAYESMGPAFDTFADWLLEDCKSQAAARHGADLEESNNSEGPLFREIARIMVIWSHICNAGSSAYFIYRDFAQFDPEIENVELSGPIRTVHMVPMGDFQVHQVTMPTSVQAVGTMLPHIHQLPSTLGPKIPMLSFVLQALYSKSGRPNRRNPGPNGGHPAPEPPLQIFEYILRKQFGLVFENSAFEWGFVDQPWMRFCQAGDIFGNASKTRCPVESAYPPPLLSYGKIHL